MITTYIKKAQKDYPEFKIKKGDSYYKWTINLSYEMKSKDPPSLETFLQNELIKKIHQLIKDHQNTTSKS